MKDNVSIRRAKAADVKVIFGFICELEAVSFDYEIFRELYTSNISDEDKVYLVAVLESNSMIVGYISCHGQLLLHHMGKVFEIQEMFVHKDYRGSGIGKLLMGSLQEYLQTHQYVSLEVTTNRFREDAIRFYIGAGFKESHLKFTREQ